MRVRVGIARALLISIAIMAVVFFGQTPASAASSSCIVKWPSTSCKTATIPARASDHSIFYNMCAPPYNYADWQVKDAANGVIVAQGRVQPRSCVTGRIRGLYGSYWGWVFNTRSTAKAFIANDR